MKGTFDHFVDATFRGRTASRLLKEKIGALKGATENDAALLKQAFGIKTIADLAKNRFFKVAQAMHNAHIELSHDPGPDYAWTQFFDRAPLDAYKSRPTEFRLDFGPSYYRGRLDNTARVLVLGQDPAANELVANRVFIGASGQRIQRFLEKLGIKRDYIMVNTFLYPVYGQVMGNMLETISHTDPILSYRNELLDRIVKHNKIEAVIAVGGAAADAIEHWDKPKSLFVQHITHPSARNNEALLANWNKGLDALKDVIAPELGAASDSVPYGTSWTPEDYTDIPRYDLPFGTPKWHGVGSHATRAKQDDGKTDPKRIIWRAP